MTKDMTTGPITPLLVNFTIPLVLGNLFQLTYNAVDSIIVGKFVGEDALAAVGTSNPLMTLAILFINGVCLGAGILVSLAFGAGNTELVERQVSTTAIAGSVFSLVFSLTCVILANPLLRLLQVPEEILPIAVNYLRIVFGGLLFTFFYNFLAATMRALGDSKSALYFLMISSVLNIGGDLFFVEVLDWGSEGCALSTVLSEALCCVFCLIYIRWKVPVLQLGRRWFIFDSSLLKKTISYGWTSAMQQATVQLGKIAIQAIVNTMGVNAMAAFTAASRIDDFAYTPQQNIGHAMTTLMAQNRGAGKTDRVRQGYHCGMRIEAVTAGGPAEEAGILVGDIITEVEGEKTLDLGMTGTRTKVRGEEGTFVTLTILRGEESFPLSVERRSIQTPVATYEMLDGQIGYIKIANFDTRCAEETNAAMDELIAQGAQALIFDVRYNGGGYKDELVKVLDKILPEGILFQSKDYKGTKQADRSDAACIKLPMAVLVNQDSYSAAEFFAAAIQEYNWGTVVGTKTVGKGNFQTAFTLSDGSMLNLSIGKYYTPQGRSLTDTGVIPDIEITLSDEDGAKLYYGQLEKADDAQLQAAIREITQKLS